MVEDGSAPGGGGGEGAPTEDGEGDSPTEDGEGDLPTEEGDDDGSADGSGDGAGAGLTETSGASHGADEAGASTDDAGRPSDREVVAAASEAAEDVVFSRYRRSDVRDVDVAVSYEDGVLEVDVYLNVPDADEEERVDEEAERVADDAALAAIEAVDRLFEEGAGRPERAGDPSG